MGKQLTLLVTFTVAPESVEAWKAAHRPVWAACGNETKCLLFDVFSDPAKPGKFRLIEVWDHTRESFEKEQLTKPYYKTLWDKSKPLWIEPIQMEYMDREGEGCSYRSGYVSGGKKMD